MIETLRIRDLALVEAAELEFGPGLNVLTGETGAGKSIVLGALGLLAGGRAETGLVREGAPEAVVEAVFQAGGVAGLGDELEARGIGLEDGALVVRRSVAAADGPAKRSRAQLGGQLVPVATLAEVLSGRLEISSQHESQALLRPESHGRLLDAHAGAEALRDAVAAGHAALRALDAEVARLRAAAEERARRQDFLAFQAQEIDEAKLRPGEHAALAAERARLVHAARLASDAGVAAACLAGEAGEGEGGAPARDRVAEAARRIDAAARLDATLEPLAARLRALGAELDDAARELERYAAGIEADPERAGAVEERLAALEKLRRKYGSDEAEILAFRERVGGELAELGGSDERLLRLEHERAAARDALADTAARLSAARRRGAAALASALEAALAELAMPGARFEIALPAWQPGAGETDLPCGPRGAEEPEILFSANAGEAAKPLRRVASGGELSRVFLALKNVLRRAGAGMVLVFDEVDAGIGGAVADRVGRVLAELAAEHQVLCITHLPQIAARASRHFRVRKSGRGGRTVTEVVALGPAERVDEIARMAGGETVTDATRRHAEALLGAAAGPAPVKAGRAAKEEGPAGTEVAARPAPRGGAVKGTPRPPMRKP